MSPTYYQELVVPPRTPYPLPEAFDRNNIDHWCSVSRCQCQCAYCLFGTENGEVFVQWLNEHPGLPAESPAGPS